MAVYQVVDIIKDVRIALDQNAMSEALTGIDDVETLSLDEIICSKIVEAVKRVHSSASLYHLNQGHNFGDTLYWKGKEPCGWILLPEDFMRLIVFQMDDWERAVYRAIDMNSQEFAMQSSRFSGVRGTPQRPKCVLTIRPEGRALEFYSCKNQLAKVSRGVYMPMPKIDNFGGIEISNNCYEAVIYTICALTATAFGDSSKSDMFNNMAKTLIE
ncbi:hypothetical protein EVA_08793 [gut metagenome]|uniref:Uncharacterized protein n=1 Tax=gut metagenome TaxID=749906 RepID=J9G798_9ZZZZ